jgi:TPR repeat protein
VYIGNLILIVFLFSCKQKEIEIITVNSRTYLPIEELKNLVLENGDTRAYDALCYAYDYLQEDNEYEYLIYSMFMANKYNYPPAYLDVYNCLRCASETYGHNIDEKTKAMALEYLNRAADLGDHNALWRLYSLYRDGELVTQDSVRSEYYHQKYKDRRAYYIEMKRKK